MKIAISQLNPTVGDFAGNRQKIEKALQRAIQEKADLILFSELILCGYPPEDFLLYPSFIEAADKALEALLPFTKGIYAVIGTLRKENENLFNTAAVLFDGKILGYQDKILLPTYDIFDEARYFKPGKESKVFIIKDLRVGITLCEDIWHHSGKVPKSYSQDPINELKDKNLDLHLNLSASPYHFKKFEERINVACRAATTLKVPMVLCNQVGGMDSLLFDGHSLVLNQKGEVYRVMKGFEEDFILVDTTHLEVKSQFKIDEIESLYKALVMGIRDYFHKSGFKKGCLGLSGGIDSALVACLGAEALGKENLTAVAMPSRFSSEGSLIDARDLAKNLDIELLEIPIEKPFEAYLNLLNPFFEGKPEGFTEENLQARIRGMILMALSNKHGLIVLSTGNKSELAMGYSTLYGDMTGGLAALSDVTKDKVYQLCKYINRDKEIIPHSTLDKPPSAELRPDQKDSDSLPPYPVIDSILEAYVERQEDVQEISKSLNIPVDVVEGLVKKIHQSEFKRRQSPPGLRITEKAFTVGRRFPIVQKFI